MKRRSFVKSALGLSALAACAKNGSNNARPMTGELGEWGSQVYTWRLVMSVPKTLAIWGPGVEAFAARVRELSRGALIIKVYGAGELVPPLGVFEAVKEGSAQMGHSASYYWQGKIPEASFFCSVPYGLDAPGYMAWIQDGGGQELWEEVYGQHGLIAFPSGNTSMQMGGWFKKEIRSPRDFSDLQMRIPGLGGRVMAKLGVKPILVPAGEIFTSLERGVIDAAEWVGPYHDYEVMGLHKAAPHYYYPGWHEPGPSLELMINRKAWDALPSGLQGVVRAANAELNQRITSQWLARDAEYLKRIQDDPKVFDRPFDSSILAALRPLADQVKEEVAETSPMARKVYESYRSFQEAYLRQIKVTVLPYYQSLVES